MITGEAKLVPHADVVPNPWNYNEQSDETFDKLVESLRRYGFVQPVITRRLASGAHEIINGEHRWRAAEKLGMRDVPIVDLGEVSDTRAKELAIVLNELGGQANTLKLSDLLRSIEIEVPREALASVMPFTDREFATFFESTDLSFVDEVNARAAAPGEAPAPGEDPAARYAALRKQYAFTVHGEVEIALVEKVLGRLGVMKSTGAQQAGTALVEACRHLEPLLDSILPVQNAPAPAKTKRKARKGAKGSNDDGEASGDPTT